jgi:tryptophanyl-tRNA synthetase
MALPRVGRSPPRTPVNVASQRKRRRMGMTPALSSEGASWRPSCCRSKSRGNAIALAASEDETVRLIQKAKTDVEREITYEPDRRPEVSNLLLLAALCLERPPVDLAAELGGAGAAGLKRLLTDALNERLRPLRQRRRELANDPGYLRSVLANGPNRAREIATVTVSDVRRLMHNVY